MFEIIIEKINKYKSLNNRIQSLTKELRLTKNENSLMQIKYEDIQNQLKDLENEMKIKTTQLSKAHYENSLIELKYENIKGSLKALITDTNMKTTQISAAHYEKSLIENKYEDIKKQLKDLQIEVIVKDDINDRMLNIEEKKFKEKIQLLKNDFESKRSRLMKEATEEKERIQKDYEISQSNFTNLYKNFQLIKSENEKIKKELKADKDKTQKRTKIFEKNAIVRGKVIDQSQELFRRYIAFLEVKVKSKLPLDHFEHLSLQYRYLPNVKKVERTVNSYNRVEFVKSLPNDLKKDSWKNILNEFDNKCALSGLEEDVTLEHFIPISTGHSGTIEANIFPLNKSLNFSKNNRNPFYWFAKNDFPVSFTIESWDKLVQTLAKKNNLSTDDYVEFINWCFEYPRTLEQIEADGNITSIELWQKHKISKRTTSKVAI